MNMKESQGLHPAKRGKRRTNSTNIDTDENEMVESIKKMTIREKEEEEKQDMKGRSDKWDEKVKNKQKKNDEEDLACANKKNKEEEIKRKREKEDSLSKIQNKRVEKKKQNDKNKIYSVSDNVYVEEIDKKFHNLVGKNYLKLPSPMNGNCQGTSKASALFSDPKQGPALSAQENQYLVDHWDYFKESITFPHSIKI